MLPITLKPINTTFDSLESFAEWLKRISAEAHDASEHQFTPDPDWPGTCVHCHWVDHETPSPTGCHHTLREHVQEANEDVEAVISQLQHVDPTGNHPESTAAFIHQMAEYIGLDTDIDPELRSVLEEIRSKSMLKHILQSLSEEGLVIEISFQGPPGSSMPWLN